MIPQKIQALLDFIDYLDSKKGEYIEKYVPLCVELQDLVSRRNELTPIKNYKDKEQYDSVQYQIIEKSPIIKSNIYTPIQNKLRELNIWSGDDTYSSIWNNNNSSIYEFKRTFKLEDVPLIMFYKQKYLSFREVTNIDFLNLYLVFQYLDEILKELFDFFKDTEKNEFDNFETKTIEVSTMQEVADGLRENSGKNVKFSIPSNILYGKSNTKEIKDSSLKIKNELIMGDKIQIENISNNSGQVSIGRNNKNESSGSDQLVKKSFKWQKFGVIAAIVLAILSIVITIILSK